MYGRRESDYSSHLSSQEEHDVTEKTTIVEEEESAADGPPRTPTDILKAQEMPRSDTPNTYITEIEGKPDITMFCDLCHIYIDIRLLRHHRAYHNALQLMGCTNHALPETSEILLKKRGAILRKMKKDATVENPLLPKQIQKVNDAYELLKAELEDTFEICRKVKDNIDTSCNATSLSSSPECVYALGMCTSPNSKWKSEMEDTKIYQDSFGENKDKCYIGLFDGYHGRFTAEVAASLLHKMFLHELMKFDNSYSLQPAEVFDAETDISHHSFVFGSHAKLDSEDEERKRKGAGDNSTENQRKGGEKDAEINGGIPVSIQPDDEELTRRIIELCEHKYGKLLEAMSSPPTPIIPSHHPKDGKKEKVKHPQEASISQALKKSYYLLDILLSYGKDEWSRVRWSGSSALTMLIESVPQGEDDNKADGETVPKTVPDITVSAAGDAPAEKNKNGDGKHLKTAKTKAAEPPQTRGYIHLANSGDVRALLVRGNRLYRLSKDHSPHNPKERDRIIKMGGQLTTSDVDSRVNGVLATTRGLGNHGDLALKNCVLVEPHTCTVQIDHYAQFLVLATRGVWEILSDQEVASLLLRFMERHKKQLPQNQIPPPSKPSSSLEGLLRGEIGGTAGDNKPAESDTVFLEAPAGGDNASSAPPTQEKRTDRGDVGATEKGAGDAEISEKSPTATAEARKTPNTPPQISADLKTEAGSHFGDADDHDHDHDLEGDEVTLPLHSDLQLEGHGSPEERRRELAKVMAEHLVQAALLAGSRDNISVMVVLLPGCGV